MNLSALGSPYLSNPRAVLENIAGALEADLITENGWVAELFASPRCLGFFKAQLLMSGDGWMDEKRWSQAMHKLAGCKQKQNGGAMLISKMLERARKAGQVVDHIIKPRSA